MYLNDSFFFNIIQDVLLWLVFFLRIMYFKLFYSIENLRKVSIESHHHMRSD